MIYQMVDWLMRLLWREKHEIGRKGFPDYLTRWVLWGKRFGPGQKVFLHCFHRGDVEEYNHDHPWPFWSLILWGGYWEWTPTPDDEVPMMGPEVAQWYGPFCLLKRPANWQHRVKIPEGKKCWTLVWCGARERSWGFICVKGWVNWRAHQANQDAGGSGCE